MVSKIGIDNTCLPTLQIKASWFLFALMWLFYVFLALAFLLSFQHPHLMLVFHILLLEVGDVAHLLFVSVDELLPLGLGVLDDLLILGEIL